MYKVEKRPFGLYSTLSGTVTVDEIREFFAETERQWPAENGPRSSILDVRALILPDHEVLNTMTQMFPKLRTAGLKRLAVLVSSPILKARAIQMAFVSDGTDVIRFFDVSKSTDWEKECNDWILQSAESTRISAKS